MYCPLDYHEMRMTYFHYCVIIASFYFSLLRIGFSFSLFFLCDLVFLFDLVFLSIYSIHCYYCSCPGRICTVVNDRLRRSYTVSVHGHRIRSKTARNGFRIRRSYKNTEWFEGKVLYSVYGAIRLPYTVVYDCIRLQYASLFVFALKVSEHITKSILWNSDNFFRRKNSECKL